MSLHTFRYGLFISHAWDHESEFEGFLKRLDADKTFAWEDLSIRRDRPLTNPEVLPRSYRSLVWQLEARIREADCIVILAGMYCAHSGWIQSEIEIAIDFGKPLIAVEPWGQTKFPIAVTKMVQECNRVGWRTESIVNKIRELATPTRQTTPILDASRLLAPWTAPNPTLTGQLSRPQLVPTMPVAPRNTVGRASDLLTEWYRRARDREGL
jgi:hypothetical protein